MLIHIVYGFFNATMAKSSIFGRDHMANTTKNIIHWDYYMLNMLNTIPLQKKLLIPGLDDFDICPRGLSCLTPY